MPLSHIREGQANYEVIDSLLSEAGVLGYEYGYSLAEPKALTLWEAQFGDFANGAQVIIDQFIAAGEAKWLRMSGLVLLLPHGYEGQGAEHSSARLGALSADLRRRQLAGLQLHHAGELFPCAAPPGAAQFPQAAGLMTPKSLLRHKLCVSALADMGPQSRFHRVLPETAQLVPDDKVKRVILCSGKVYYDLFEERAKRGIKDVAIVRVEQLYPWPKDTISSQIRRYPCGRNRLVPGRARQYGRLDVRHAAAQFHPRGNQPRPASSDVLRPRAVGGGGHRRASSSRRGTGASRGQALTAPLGDLRQPFRRATRLGDYQYAAAK